MFAHVRRHAGDVFVDHRVALRAQLGFRVGQTSSLTSKAYDMEAAQASRLSQSPSDQV